MILGIGTDILEIARMQKALARMRTRDRFIRKVFTDYEIKKGEALCGERRFSYYAKRFAAKEACAKAMGRSFSGDFALKDIGVVENEFGRPELVLTGNALKTLNSLMPHGYTPRLHLSLSDEKGYALAFVVAEASCL